MINDLVLKLKLSLLGMKEELRRKGMDQWIRAIIKRRGTESRFGGKQEGKEMKSEVQVKQVIIR